MADTAMDYEAVQGFVDSFGEMGEVFKKVSTVLQAAITILRATAFFGAFGTAALARYLSGIKPHIDRLSATCGEFNSDLRAAMSAHVEADEAAEGRF